MRQTKPKANVKEVMQLHSQAKVEFYGKYLQRYLRILYRPEYISQINIFDVFCGMGIYKDGGKGSPIVAYDIIKDVFYENGQKLKVQFIINDADSSRVENVKSYIDSHNSTHPCCGVHYHNEDAEDMLAIIQDYVSKTRSNTRNLIFIDPYGYKQINREVIEGLMSNGKTEILLFLPISHMYRFTQYAVENAERTQYQPLNDFVKSFFSYNHPIVQDEDITVMEYISYLRLALNFDGRFYTTSYHIERNRNSYFALFFLSANLLGYEKTLEVKWVLDTEDGNGFNLPKEQPGLFDAIDRAETQDNMYQRLRSFIIQFLKTPRTNHEIYKFTLQNEFLPIHANQVLKKLQEENMINVQSIKDRNTARKGAFYLSYDNCKNDPKILIGLNS
jgi:three-Cys-motif partner protein